MCVRRTCLTNKNNNILTKNQLMTEDIFFKKIQKILSEKKIKAINFTLVTIL